MKYEQPRSVSLCPHCGPFPLESRLLRARDDLVLRGGSEVAEVVAVAGYAHDQVAVALGMRLRRRQGWRMSLSVPLVLEYEQTLKRICAGDALSGSDIDVILYSLCADASLRPIFFLWRPLLPDPKDDFVLELAVESRADFLLTFNTKDFAGAERFGIRVITPREFLAIIGEAP